MAASFPGSIKSFSTKLTNDTIEASHVNDLQDEVTAIETSALPWTVGQFLFPATQNPSANVNTLDDYEEGTWVPVIGGAGGTGLGQTYTNQEGRYIKIGSLVWAGFHVTLSNKDTITGAVQIQGLPFTAENSVMQFYAGMPLVFVTLATNWTNLLSFVNQNSTVAPVVGVSAAAASVTNLVTGDIANTTSLRGAYFYRAAN